MQSPSHDSDPARPAEDARADGQSGGQSLDDYLQQLQERYGVDLDTALRLAWLWPAA
jgi:hypothetical protein